MAVRKKADTTIEDAVFTKENILTMVRYANRRDLLVALLNEKHEYTLEEVDVQIKTFMKGKVK